MLKTIFFILHSLTILNLQVECEVITDQIHDLPGLPHEPNFRQYSGYLKGYYPDHHLHYWFVESQQNVTNDPLVLWLNGGPGCSSLDGLLTENGPFTLQKDGRSFVYHNFSWNKIANVLYLESPVGVGFSYSSNTEDYKTDDNRTTIDNFYAIKNFFSKYPEFLKNDFYITGESYGGMYVPQLTKMVADLAPDIKLKGFAIGNGYLDKDMNDISVYFYYFYHGFIGQRDMNLLTAKCCGSSYNMRDCNPENKGCLYAMTQVNIGRVNMYNVFQKCYPTDSPTNSSLSRIEAEANHIQHLKPLKDRGVVIPCIDSTYLSTYLNQKSVRQALHIPEQLESLKWSICSEVVNLNYKRLYNTMRSHVLSLTGRSIRGMIYNGDFDTACNFLGDEWFVDSLGLSSADSRLKYYQYNKQVAGYYKKYDNLKFVTVKGAGHMVPTDQPEIAFHIYKAFLYDLSL